MTLFPVSQSKVRDWRQCHQRFWYKNVLKIQRKRRPRPFAFGGIIHRMKETMANGKDPFSVLDKLSADEVNLFKEEREYYGDIISDIRYIFRAYLKYWKKQPLVFLKHGKQRAEHSFELKLPKEDILVKGTIDAATEYRGLIWLTEHKNHKNIPNDDERWRSVQSIVYIKVSQMLGWWDFEGTCWDYIRSKPPSRPQILKTGDVSGRALDSLPEVVIDTLKEHEKNPANYSKMIDQQSRNMSTWFQRVYTPVKLIPLKTIWGDFIQTSREIRDTNLDKPQVRTIGRHCSWCEFEPLCRASLQGGDEEFIKEHHYETSTYGSEQETEE